MFAILGRSFWLLVFLMVLFGWMALVGVVRAEFLRARNLEYVRAAQGAWVSQHRRSCSAICCPTRWLRPLTMLPFMLRDDCRLAALDFLGFGLPSSRRPWGDDIAGQAEPCRRRGWPSPRFYLLPSCCRCLCSSLRACAMRLTPERLSHDPLLTVRDLTVAFRQDGQTSHAVRGVSFLWTRRDCCAWSAKAGRASL